jgi:hypothetical protein
LSHQAIEARWWSLEQHIVEAYITEHVVVFQLIEALRT